MNPPDGAVPEWVVEPPLLQDDQGKTISTRGAWERRRVELLELFRSQVYGRVPETPYEAYYEETDPEEILLAGAVKATLIYVTIRIETPNRRGQVSWRIPLLLPVKDTEEKLPIFIVVGNSCRPNRVDTNLENPTPFWPTHEIIKVGFATACFYNGDIAPDDKDDSFPTGIVSLLDEAPRTDDAWGAIAAWSWGFSRIIDYLETKKSDAINTQQIAIVGQSRGGKAALWAAAQDDRIAMACSNDSGNTGASLSRHCPQGAETIERINTRFPHWFCRNYRQYNFKENDLPIDQHQLAALIAPRTLYVASATLDLWADPKGEYLATCEASKVWSKIYQIVDDDPQALDPQKMPGPDEPSKSMSGHVSYHKRTGKHDLTLFDWQQYVARAKQVFGRTDFW